MELEGDAVVGRLEPDRAAIAHRQRQSGYDPDRAASHSKRVVEGIIRQKWGYQGVVMTDDLAMGAIYQNDVCKAVVEAINAGVDLLLVAYDGAEFYRIFTCAVDGARQGKLDAARERSAAGKRLPGRAGASRLTNWKCA